MNYKLILAFIILLSTFLSCGMSRQSVKQIITYEYKNSYSNNPDDLTKIDFSFYKRKTPWKDDMKFNKTLHFIGDSVLNHFSINYNPVYDFGHEDFYFSYSPPIEFEKESLSLNYGSWNDTVVKWFEFESKQEDENNKLTDYYLNTSYFSDSLDYFRTVQLSDEAIEKYRAYAYKNINSLSYFEIPPIVESKKNSKLFTSTFRSFKPISKEKNIYRSLQIDSSFVNGELKVERKVQDYFYINEVNESGIRIYIKNPLPQNNYRERHFKKNEHHPVYELQYNLDTISRDTSYRLEMKSSRNEGGILYTYDILEDTNKEKDTNDLRIPIIRRKVEVLTDEKGDIIKFHSFAFTNEGHKLEYAYALEANKKKPYKWRVLTDNRTIPEISASQKYDIEIIAGYSYHRGYSHKIIIHKQIQKREAEYEAKKRPRHPLDAHIRKTTKSIEKDRKNNFEKRISIDGRGESIYHIWYFDN